LVTQLQQLQILGVRLGKRYCPLPNKYLHHQSIYIQMWSWRRFSPPPKQILLVYSFSMRLDCCWQLICTGCMSHCSVYKLYRVWMKLKSFENPQKTLHNGHTASHIFGMTIFDLGSFYIPRVSHFYAFWYLTLRDEFMIPFKNTCEFLSYQNCIEISKIAPRF